MSKVIIAFLVLLFSLIFLLLFCIIFMALALVLFPRRGKKRTPLHPEIKGD